MCLERALWALTLGAGVLALADGVRADPPCPPGVPARFCQGQPQAPTSTDETRWRNDDPSVPHPDRAEFCPGHVPLRGPAPRAVGDRRAQYVLDGECRSAASVVCSGGSPIDVRRSRPRACIAIRLTEGTGSGERESMLMPLCGACPEGTGPESPFPECDPAADLPRLRRGGDVYNVRAIEVARLQTLYAEANRLSAGTGPAPIWQNMMLEVLRGTARMLNYCSDTQPLLPHDERVDAWTFGYGRIDLNKSLLFGGVTAGQGTALEVQPFGGLLRAYPRGFEGDTRGVLDFDGLAIALVHETRHMATPEYGSGANGHTVAERSAEHRLNELQDYAAMFEHPLWRSFTDATRARLRGAFESGRNDELGCFGTEWNVTDPTRGYPRDAVISTAPARAAAAAPVDRRTQLGFAMLGGLGLLGGGMPMAVGRAPQAPPMVPPAGFNAGRCGAPLGADASRCRVVDWAHGNVGMRQQMVLSGGGGPDAQPWNTLAHWIFLAPIVPRAVAPCTDGRPNPQFRPPAAPGRGGGRGGGAGRR